MVVAAAVAVVRIAGRSRIIHHIITVHHLSVVRIVVIAGHGDVVVGRIRSLWLLHWLRIVAVSNAATIQHSERIAAIAT